MEECGLLVFRRTLSERNIQYCGRGQSLLSVSGCVKAIWRLAHVALSSEDCPCWTDQRRETETQRERESERERERERETQTDRQTERERERRLVTLSRESGMGGVHALEASYSTFNITAKIRERTPVLLPRSLTHSFRLAGRQQKPPEVGQPGEGR